MRKISADHAQRVDIAGVAFPRPVSVDNSQTGFTHLRSLRIYHFAEGSVIDGHAEEDEVVIVVLAGSIELVLSAKEFPPQTFTLQAPVDAPGGLCAAYLPPLGEYRLLAKTDAEVAYARATPADGPLPRAFPAGAGSSQVLFEEVTYPRKLRVRMLQVVKAPEDVDVTPLAGVDAEALIHVRLSPEHGVASITTVSSSPVLLASGDTAAVAPGERPVLRVENGLSAVVLVVFA